MNRRFILRTVAPLFLAISCTFAGADELTDRAGQLLEQGKAKEAYALLNAEEKARAGDPAFDLLFGVAAIEVGQHTRAVFALERVLATQPGNVRARAEIARAYLALGETTVARQEFESVQKQDIPPEVAATIDRYLAVADRIDRATRTTVRAYIEATLGYDSNVNAAPDKNSIAIPAFGGAQFTLANDSKANTSGFGTLGAGASIRHPVTHSFALLGSVSGNQRKNPSAEVFDSAEIDASGGISFSTGAHVFSLTGQYNRFNLNGVAYRIASGFSGQWQHHLDARNQLSAFIQSSKLDYETQPIRDAVRHTGGLAYAHAFRSGEVIFASAYAFTEEEDAANVPWLGQNGAGLRLGGQMNVHRQIAIFAQGALEQRKSGANDPLFSRTRSDTQLDLTLGAIYTPAKNWQLRPKLILTRNSSNIELNDYDRAAVSLTLRREF